VQAFVDRDARAYFYFRRRGSPRVRLPGLPWSPQFMAAYQRALDQSKPLASKRGTIADAVDRYLPDDHVHNKWARSTRMNRRRILLKYASGHGHKQIMELTTIEVKETLAAMPKRGAAEDLLKALRPLMKWCLDQGIIKTDPTVGVRMSRRKTDGYHTWTEDEIAQFEAHHPIGSKPRLAFALLLHTAQRRGDVIRMGRQHIRDGVLHVKQQKTGAGLAIPVLPELQAIIDATPSEHLTFIVSALGKPFHRGSFSNWFRAQCDAAGLPKGCSAHGLRKAACRRLAEAGCTVHQIAAISGHVTLEEVQRYTKAADQARLARSAMATVIKARPEVSKPEPTLTPARLTGRRDSKKS
jgi:integrase